MSAYLSRSAALRSFELQLTLTKEQPAAAQGAAVVKMAPSSALLRLFVSPVLPMGLHGGKAHPIDGELVVHSGGG
jgi:hypothetical protein